MSPDRLAAGKTADGLINHCLENRGSQIFLGSSVIDQSPSAMRCSSSLV